MCGRMSEKPESVELGGRRTDSENGGPNAHSQLSHRKVATDLHN